MKALRLKSAAAAVALVGAFGWVQAAPGVIDTGTVRMGLFDSGGLGGTGVGLQSTFLPVGDNDAITPGCLCEGWGASAGTASGWTYGGVNSGVSSANLTITTASGPGLSAQSIVTLANGLQVTHDYSYAAGGLLFKVQVTLTNTTAASVSDVRYARTLDWDVPPGHFDDDFTTIYGGTPTGPGGAVLHTSTNPFAAPDPLLFRAQNADTNVVDAPGDLGGYFVLGFGDLAAGDSTTFDTYIGAGRTTGELLGAFASVGIEAFTYTWDGIGFNNPGPSPNGVTYGWGFSGLGLPPVFETPTPGSLALVGIALLGLSATRRRQR
jgi:type IV pilus assembly protein PilY1